MHRCPKCLKHSFTTQKNGLFAVKALTWQHYIHETVDPLMRYQQLLHTIIITVNPTCYVHLKDEIDTHSLCQENDVAIKVFNNEVRVTM